MPAAARRPAGAAVLCGAIPLLELLLPDAAAEVWLDSALVRAESMRLDRTVEDPVVGTEVEEPLVTVERFPEVETAVAGRELAPGTPPTPDRVVSPVLVKVDPPLVMTVVKVLVVIAEAEPPKMVVYPTVVVKVDDPLVTTETMADVEIAEEAGPCTCGQPSPNRRESQPVVQRAYMLVGLCSVGHTLAPVEP